jgi:hypothetical protein
VDPIGASATVDHMPRIRRPLLALILLLGLLAVGYIYTAVR